MKKKFLAMALTVAMALSVMACGTENGDSEISQNMEQNNKLAELMNRMEDNTQEATDEETTEMQADNSVELTDEYLLSLPETSADKFWYEETDDGCIRIEGIWDNDDVNEVIVIPAQIDGKDVTEISYEAFKFRVLAAVVTGKNVKEIGKGAFSGAEIKKVLINGPVTEIKADTFSSTGNSFEEVVLPETIEVIRQEAFRWAEMKSIVIPASIKVIECSAFVQTDLEEIHFEGGSGTIEKAAFSMFNADELTVYIPDCSLVFDGMSFDDVSVTEGTEITIVTPAGSSAEEVFKASGVNVENN